LHLETSTSIAAPPDRVWPIILDVERWPEWTSTMTSVERLDSGDLSVGSKVRIKQPKIPGAVVWTVTQIDPGRYMEWTAKSPINTTVGGHRVEPEREGSRVTLTIDQTGILSVVMGWWFKKLTNEYMAIEAAGLKSRAEGASAAVDTPD
jgi:hypothetical protein